MEPFGINTRRASGPPRAYESLGKSSCIHHRLVVPSSREKCTDPGSPRTRLRCKEHSFAHRGASTAVAYVHSPPETSTIDNGKRDTRISKPRVWTEGPAPTGSGQRSPSAGTPRQSSSIASAKNDLKHPTAHVATAPVPSKPLYRLDLALLPAHKLCHNLPVSLPPGPPAEP